MTGGLELAFRDFGGQGRPLVILHGLFGSSQNWVGMGRRLTSLAHCYALDLRNHGDSPHDPSNTLADCVSDVRRWAEDHRHAPIALVGHSMGGLVAMGFAIRHPELTERLVVVDIAPKPYPVDHEQEFAALHTDISACRSRAELDALISPLIPEQRLRAFLLTNAVRSGAGYRWRVNVGALENARIFGDFPLGEGAFGGEALFLLGGRSSSVKEEDLAAIRLSFARAIVQRIPEGDHWLHVSAPEAFLGALQSFLH